MIPKEFHQRMIDLLPTPMIRHRSTIDIIRMVDAASVWPVPRRYHNSPLGPIDVGIKFIKPIDTADWWKKE